MFECTVKDTDSKTTWFKDGKKIKFSDLHYRQVDEGPVRKLIVKKAVKKDEGEYTVKVGKKEVTATLKVKGKYEVIKEN